MEFGLSDEQKMLEDSLRGFLSEHLTLDKLRTIAERGDGWEVELWHGLIKQGITGLLIPERFGGAGLSLLDAAVVAESLGYHAAPAPFAASLVMAPLAFMLGGSEAEQSRWLPRIADGEVRFGVGFESRSGRTGESSVSLEANRLCGRVTGVIDGGAATHFLVYLVDGCAAVVAKDAGVKAHRHRSLDRTRPVTELVFDKAEAMILNATNDSGATATRALDAGRVILAADTLGAAQSMFDKALAYSKERVQFNRTIGSFQGVKHTLADLITALEPCRALVWFAAHAQNELRDEARVAALQAKAHLGDVGRAFLGR